MYIEQPDQINVSIVIATFRRPRQLIKCLDALKEQVFPDGECEIIIVTDGPDPATIQAVNQRDDWFIYRVYSPHKKRGLAAARNFGWQRATGKLVLFTHDDCLPGPYWVGSYWLAYQVCIYYSMTRRPSESPVAFRGPVCTTSAGTGLATSNFACSRKVLEMVGGFDEAFDMAWHKDTRLELKLIRFAIPIFQVSSANVTRAKTHWLRRNYYAVTFCFLTFIAVIVLLGLYLL